MKNDEASPIFVLSMVDDYGFTPSQYRMLMHISRRGHCWASIRTMSGTVKMHRDSVCRALKVLLDHNAIIKQKNAGYPSTYHVNINIKTWKNYAQSVQSKGYPSNRAPAPDGGPRRVNGTLEQEFFLRLRNVIPVTEMQKNGGMWRTLMRENPEKFDRALADLELKLREAPKTVKNRGGTLMSLYQMFQ